MPKDAYLNARVDKQTKAKAQKVLAKVGLSTTDAVNLFLHQIVLNDGLPFPVRVPNKATREAIEESRKGGGERFAGTGSELVGHLLRPAKKRKA